MTTLRPCRDCEKSLPLTEFAKCSTHLGGDGYVHVCNGCRKQRRATKSATSPDTPQPQEVKHTGPKISLTPTIGFSAQLRDDDVVVWQNSDSGEQAVWLSRSEARQLASFITGLDAAGAAG